MDHAMNMKSVASQAPLPFSRFHVYRSLLDPTPEFCICNNICPSDVDKASEISVDGRLELVGVLVVCQRLEP